MGGPSLSKSKSDFLLIILWEPENLTAIAGISSHIPDAEVHHYCLQAASKQLLQESRSAPAGVRPARYVFNELLSTSRDFDEETTAARDRLLSLLRRTTILVTLSSLPPNSEYVPNLQMIHLFSAGVDQVIDHPLIKGAHIDITTSSGIHGISLAEWALMATLCVRKSFLTAHEMQKNHDWPKDKSMFSRGKDLYGRRVGIIGYGSIGRQVSRLFSAFGCSIIALTATSRPDPGSRVDHKYIIPGTGDPSGAIPSTWISGTDKSSLHHFLSLGLDILVLSLPLLPSTANLISTEELQVLSENPSSNGKCFLINIARGRIIDQTALVQALNAEIIAGAALDVAVPEPLPQDSPLWNAKNVIITPHISTLSSDYQSRAFDLLVTNLGRRARGEKMLNLVDWGKGY